MNEHAENWQQSARLRAGDSDRQQAIDKLTQAWRGGHISRDEFQDRSQQTMSVTYTDELDTLLADLGGPAAYLAPANFADSGPVVVRDSWQADDDSAVPAVYAPAGTPGSALSFAIMGGMDKTGDWVVAPNHVSIAFWGGTTIDLRDAVFTNPETTITCIAVMGGVEVIVPPEMEVQVTGIGFMGGFGWDKLRHSKPRRQPTEGNPRVTINGLGFWGGVGIVRKERDDYEDIDD